MIDLLIALIRIFPELLAILDPSHPVTQQIKQMLPVESESQKVVNELEAKQ